MLKITSYCTPEHAAPMDLLFASARRHGADEAQGWTRRQLEETAFYRAHRRVFDAARGAGYWAWKPFFLLETLKAAAEGDIIIYNDAGRHQAPFVVDRPLGTLADWVVRHRGGLLPGVYIPQWGLNRHWTKGECFRAMGCDVPAVRDHPQVQATFSVWQRNDRALDFVSDWLRWCVTMEAISDEKMGDVPDAPDFRDHRFDQSVLTNLTLGNGLTCFGDPHRIAIGGNRINASDKHIGHLIDRIEGRTWAIRSRIAREDRRLAGLAAPVNGRLSLLRRAKRLARSWRDATANYPVSSLDPLG
jgi:hypothetical protein